MEKTCKDSAFGHMSYNRRWYKQQQISMFGKKWTITVVARAYSGRSITFEQQNAYLYFMDHEKEMIEIIGDQLKLYVNKNFKLFSEYWKEARPVVKINDLAEMVTPKTLLFKQDGTTIMLFDCVWDPEQGVGVELAPDVNVAPQDMFL